MSGSIAAQCTQTISADMTAGFHLMHLMLNPALWVIISSALKWYTAAEMCEILFSSCSRRLPCFLTVFTDIHHSAGVFATGGQLPVASYKLSDSLSYPPCLALTHTPATCGQWLRSSFAPSCILSTHSHSSDACIAGAFFCLTAIANGLFALWINFLWQ